MNAQSSPQEAKVTAQNYVRAESDTQMKGYIESFNCLGVLVKHHHRANP